MPHGENTCGDELRSGGSYVLLATSSKRMYQRKILKEVSLNRNTGFPGGSVVKNPPAMQKIPETWVRSLGQEDPGRRAWPPTPVFLPGEFHGQRSLVGCSPWGRRESDTHNCISTCLSIHPSTYPATCLIYQSCILSLSLYLSIHPFYLSNIIHPSTYLPI